MQYIDDSPSASKSSLLLLFFALITSIVFVTSIENTHADTTAPRNVTITLNAIDDISGVYMMEVTDDENNPGSPIPFSVNYSFVTASANVYVRLEDRAGNWTNWTTIPVGGAPVVNASSYPTPTLTSLSTTPTPTPTPAAAAAAAPAAAAGGAAAGGSADSAYFRAVITKPTDPTTLYTANNVCIDVFDGPTFTFDTTLCTSGNGYIAGPVKTEISQIRVYPAGFTATPKVYAAISQGGLVEVLGTDYFAGTKNNAVTFNDPSATPPPSESPTPATSPTPQPTPIAATSPTPQPTPTQMTLVPHTVTPSSATAPTASASPSAPGRKLLGAGMSVLVGSQSPATTHPAAVIAALTAGKATTLTTATGATFVVTINALPKTSALTASITINGKAITLGTFTSTAKGQLALPQLNASSPGSYLITLKSKGKSYYVKVVVRKR
jgi:hypothetical protein